MIDSTVRHRGPSPFLIVGRKRQGRAGGGRRGITKRVSFCPTPRHPKPTLFVLAL